MHSDLKLTPWDSKVFGINTYEITQLSEAVLKETNVVSGHFTIKVTPLSSKKLLYDYGFYYCDTLIEPYCTKDKLIRFTRDDIQLTQDMNYQELLNLSHGAFVHGRYHRDFNIIRNLSDLRYDNWLESLYQSGNIIGFLFNNELTGYFGCCENKVVLHALKSSFRGKGLAKFFWSSGYQYLFSQGYGELSSSISATNMSVLNLYTSLGFRFRNPVDVYHKLQR